jgi:hypothetical protein
MIAKVHSPLTSPKKHSERSTSRPYNPPPLDTNCTDVTAKLKRALRKAQSGATAGALIIALDHRGAWSVDLAGQLLHDDDTLCLITCRMLGACLAAK